MIVLADAGNGSKTSEIDHIADVAVRIKAELRQLLVREADAETVGIARELNQ